MKDIQKLIDAKLETMIKSKNTFDILYVTDENSRLATTRGQAALDEFRHFYATLANVSLVTMDSRRFAKIRPDLGDYNIVWVDNVFNRDFNQILQASLGELLDKLVPDWSKEYETVDTDEAKDDFYGKLLAYRALHCRVIYALDEFVWDAPAGRQKNIITVKTAEDAMQIADEVVVPNKELADAIREFGLVSEDKDVVAIPTFMSDSFFPVNRDFHKSSSYATSIKTPRVLVKGTVIPKNVQEFIIDNVTNTKKDLKKFKFAISSVGELDERLMRLIAEKKVENLVHWANPYLTNKNMLKTQSLERDGSFDFVLLTVPENAESDVYNITNVDTDALMAIASGAVAIAGVDELEYGKGMHICVDTKLTFGLSTSVRRLQEMLTQWSICTNWDTAYDSQHKILNTRLVTSPSVLGGYFNAMLGRTLSEARKDFFGKDK